MKPLTLVFSAFLIAAPMLPAQAQMVNFASVQQEGNKMMTQALENAIRDIESSDGGVIRITRLICPHAIEALAALGSGAVAPRDGQMLFMQGLVQDGADMLKARILGGPMLDFAKGTGVSVEFSLARGVTPDDLIGVAKAGIEAMN